jgi:hypothetical protein
MADPDKHKPWLLRFLEGAGGLIALALVFVSVFYGLTSWVDSRIKAVVTDENYIRRVAAEVRPSVIFNGKGNVLVDQGAMRYLDGSNGIHILGYQDEANWPGVPARILIRPKQHLAYAPLLIPLDPTVSGSDVERTNQFDWVYSVYTGPVITEPRPSPQFRLEILQ